MDIHLEKMGFDPEKIRELLAQQYAKENAPSAASETSPTAEDGTPIKPEKPFPSFDIKPEELIAYLDQYVIRQDEAKAILSTKICTHFNRLNLPDSAGDDIGNIKNNIMMIGPTGVGKTFIIKLIARRLGVPFVKADATKFSETGYVGGDVEDLVRDLVREADGDINKAQHGIIYIDEIDKIAASQGVSGPDVSRAGVQRNLLKLMEETEVDLKAPHDLASQMETVMQMQRTGSAERPKINTRDILFVVSGAFSGLDEIIGRRLNRGAMGFRPAAETKAAYADKNLLSQVRSEDLVAFGFESEFIGRLPVTAVLDELSRDDLLEILRTPKSSVILSKKRDFLAYGIEAEFTDAALQLLADRAYEEHTGARGLVGAVERALLIFERKLPSTDIDRFVITEKTVLAAEESLEELVFEASLKSYIDDFARDHGIELRFAETARSWLREAATAQDRPPAAICTELLADYGHGLKLIGHTAFEIDRHLLETPKESLNQLIKESYDTPR